MLADVGEDQEEQPSAAAADEEADDDDGRSLTSPFSHEDDPFVQRQPFSLAAGAASLPAPPEASSSSSASSPVASVEEQQLRQQLEAVESERDALAEDVDGWRSRCKLLEDKLAEEKRIAIVERDLSRERIRKRASSSLPSSSSVLDAEPFPSGLLRPTVGDRLASLTPDENTSVDHLTAQTRLVTEMRDQIFSLASSLARSEEMRKQAEESLRDELDERERQIAEAIDEDRRERRAAIPMQQQQRPAVGASIAPPTPPLLSGSNSSVSSNVSTNRSSYGAGPSQQLHPPQQQHQQQQRQASDVQVASEDDGGGSPATGSMGGYDSWKASPWGAGGAVMQPTGEIGPADGGGFNSVPPRPLEALVEETDEEDAHDGGGGGGPRPFHAPLAYEHRSFDSLAYDLSDDNAALGLDHSGDFDPDGFDEDLPHNFLSPRPGDGGEHDDEDDNEAEADPKTPVPLGYQPDLTAPYGPTPGGGQAQSAVDLDGGRYVSTAAYGPPAPAPVIQEPPPMQVQQQHSKRHSLQRTWVMPRGPVVASPEERQSELAFAAAPTTSARFGGADEDEDEDVKPFGTWVVPPSPFFSTEAADDGSRFASNAFPSALATPTFPSALGYNDPPQALFNQRAGPSGSVGPTAAGRSLRLCRRIARRPSHARPSITPPTRRSARSPRRRPQ
jgi:hypothetical protein